LEEHGYIGEAVRVLQIGRAENEGFSEKVIDDTKVEWQIFWHCLQVYRLRKIAA
jgi:RNase P/RNase MRP subunit p29